MRKNGKGHNIRSGVSDLDGFMGCIMASRAILLLVLEKMLVMFGYLCTLGVTEGHMPAYLRPLHKIDVSREFKTCRLRFE